jgi:CBS domain-containing protein
MLVRDLIAKKGATPLITVEPGATVGRAAQLMLQHNVGALPVLDGGHRLVGFLAERDLIEALDRRGSDVRGTPVSVVMRTAPTCTADEKLTAAMARMTHHRARQLVVMDGQRPVGIISVGDIVKHRLDELETETGVLRDYVAAHRVKA